MIFIPFEIFSLLEKISIPNTDFVSKILWDLKHNELASEKMIDLSEEEIISLMNDKFKEHNIGFAPVYQYNDSIRQMATKEFKKLGIGGALTAVDGTIVIIIMSEFFENFDDKYEGRIFKRFVAAISELVGHELIHREQFKKMNPKYLEELAKKIDAPVGLGGTMYPFEYYGNEKEISAFANQAIDDLVRHKFVKSTIEDFLKNPKDWIGSNPSMWTSEKNFKKFSMAYIVYYLLFKDVDDKIWNKCVWIFCYFGND